MYGIKPAPPTFDATEMVWREGLPNALAPTKHLKYEPEMNARKGKKNTVYTVEEISNHNKKDDLWVMIDGKVYDITKYVDTHPGGWLPMTNMGGKDCTDAFCNYHPAYVYKEKLPSFYIGDVANYSETPFVKAHREIRQKLLAEGRFTTKMSYYYLLYARLAMMFAGVIYLSIFCESFWAHMCGAALLGLFWQQIAFIGHDIGHNAISHDWATDNRWGLFFGNFATGIGIGWWKRSHNVHHIVCNSIENDPDIQHLPIMSVTNEAFGKWWSTYHEKWMITDSVTRFLVSYQHYLFYPIMAFARFNLYAQSYILAFNMKEKIRNRAYEIITLTGFITWLSALIYFIPANTYGGYEKIAFLFLSHNIAGVLHVQICLSHFAMDTYHGQAYNDDKDEWFRMQLATTLNINCYPWMDWFHGGLQFQIEHHLWPRLPRHELRYASELVQEFCKENNVYYHYPAWIPAQIELVARLKKVAMEARNLKKGDGGFYESAIWEGLNAHG